MRKQTINEKEDLFRTDENTVVTIVGGDGNIEEVNIGIGPEGGKLSLKANKIILDTNEGCFNCLYRDGFHITNNSNLKVICGLSDSFNEPNLNGLCYKKDKKGGSKSIRELDLNFSK